MTPEKFLELASAEKAMADQLKATGQTITAETLSGCLMAAVQIARHLKVGEEVLLKQVKEHCEQWEQYTATKRRIDQKRRGK